MNLPDKPPGPRRIELPDTGDYMSGNILSKGLDLLGTVNFAAAGAADAALHGESIGSGAMRGIRGRMSFMDTFRGAGMPGIAAVPLGLLADIAIPVAPGVGALAKAGGLARVGKLAGELRDVEHGVEDILNGAGRVAETTLNDAQRAHAAANAAADAFEVGGTTAAREAAAASRGASEPLREGAERIMDEAEYGPKHGSTAREFLKGWSSLKNTVLAPFRTFLEEHPSFHGFIGKKFGDLADTQQRLERRMMGELALRMDAIANSVPKHLRNAFTQGVHTGVVPAELQPMLARPLLKFRQLADELFDAAHKRGIRQVLTTHSIVYQRLTTAEKGFFRQAMADLQSTMRDAPGEVGQWHPFTIRNGRQVEEKWVPREVWDRMFTNNGGKFAVALAQHAGGTIDDSGKAVANLRYHENWAPLIPKKFKVIERKRTELPQVMDAVRAQFPHMQPEEVRAVAEQVITQNALEAGDVSRQFQYNRRGTGFFNPEDYEGDPRKWGAKLVKDYSQRLARAQVWQGDDGLWNNLLREYDQLNGVIQTGTGITAKVSADARAGRDALLRGWAVLQGEMDDPTNPLLKAANLISDTLFLSPKTILLQASTLPNVGALAGVGRSLGGVAVTMSDPAVRQLARRLGVATPGIMDALLGRPSDLVKRWNVVLRGIGATDKAVRLTAAVSVGASIAADEEKVLKLLAAGNRAKAEKIIGFMERTWGINGQVLRDGKTLSQADFLNAMQRGADMTNFTGDVTQLSKLFQGNAGRFFLKFKAYAFQQSGFINRLLKEGTVHGNWTPLARYAMMFPAVYAPVMKVANSLRAGEQQVYAEERPLEYIRTLLLTGALGYFGDAGMALGSDSEALGLGVVTGPNVGALLKVKQSAKDLLPWRFDGAAAMQEITPQTIKQARNLWENSQ